VDGFVSMNAKYKALLNRETFALNLRSGISCIWHCATIYLFLVFCGLHFYMLKKIVKSVFVVIPICNKFFL
jgi:hypothetical protein